MSVWYRQSVDGEPGIETVIDSEAHPDIADDDLALLVRKANGAADKGWTVTWTGDHSFTATKDRWGGSLCVREFWAD